MQRYNCLRKLVTWNPEDLMRMIMIFSENSAEQQRIHLKNLFITLDCPDMTEMIYIIASCRLVLFSKSMQIEFFCGLNVYK